MKPLEPPQPVELGPGNDQNTLGRTDGSTIRSSLSNGCVPVFKIFQMAFRGLEQLVVFHVPYRLRGRTSRDTCQVHDELSQPDIRAMLHQLRKQLEDFLFQFAHVMDLSRDSMPNRTGDGKEVADGIGSEQSGDAGHRRSRHGMKTWLSRKGCNKA